MNKISSEDILFENSIKNQIFLVLCYWFVLVFTLLVALHISVTFKDHPDSWLTFVMKVLGLIINLVVLMRHKIKPLSPSSIMRVGLIINSVNFTILFYTAVLQMHTMQLAVLVFLYTPVFVVVLGFFARRTLFSLISSVILIVVFLFVFVFEPDLFFSSKGDLLLTNIDRFKDMGILYAGVILVGTLGVIVLNQFISNRIFRKLHSDNEYMRNLAYYDQESGLPNGRKLEQSLTKFESSIDTDHEILILVGVRFEGISDLNIRLGYDISSNYMVRIVLDLKRSLDDWGKTQSQQYSNFYGDLFRIDSRILIYICRVERKHWLSDEFSTSTMQSAVNSVLNQYPECAVLDYYGAFDVYPIEAHSVVELHQHVFNMLNQHSHCERSSFLPFNVDNYNSLLRREKIKEYLKKSDFSQQLRTVFQPKVSVDGKHTKGFEALVRWTSPELGAITPAEFIPVAENSMAISLITDHVVHQTIALIQQLIEGGATGFRISFNLSPALLGSDYLEHLLEIVSHCNCCEFLEIEITESTLAKTSVRVDDIFSQIKALGVSFSIDDFGTGYSNLASIQSFSADTLKIDKSFIDGILVSENSMSLVKTIINMAISFGMSTVAEGVETAEQVQILFDAGCDQIQGYYFSRPLEFDSAIEWYLTSRP